MMSHRLLLAAATTLVAAAQPAAPALITIAADQPGVKVSPSLWGIFYEEINHVGDGGIYAELVQNRAFEDRSQPLKDQTPHALRLEVNPYSPGLRAPLSHLMRTNHEKQFLSNSANHQQEPTLIASLRPSIPRNYESPPIPQAHHTPHIP